jgi:hypothetical protein
MLGNRKRAGLAVKIGQDRYNGLESLTAYSI